MKNKLSITGAVIFFIVISLCYAISDTNLTNNIYSINISVIETEPLNTAYLDMSEEQAMVTVLLANELFIKKIFDPKHTWSMFALCSHQMP